MVRIRTIVFSPMTPHPRIASARIRERILDCLREETRHGFHPDSIRFLNQIDFRASDLVTDLIEDLERFELFHKPRTDPNIPAKYQFVMRYDDGALLIHVTLTPRDTEPPRVKLAVHRHNIPGPPLPLIPIKGTP